MIVAAQPRPVGAGLGSNDHGSQGPEPSGVVKARERMARQRTRPVRVTRASGSHSVGPSRIALRKL